MRWSTLCTMVVVGLCLAGCGDAENSDDGTTTTGIDTRIEKPKNPVPPPGRGAPPTNPQMPADDSRFAVGKIAPDIVGEDIDGVEFKLSDYRGKVVFLDFWGDW